MSAHSPQMNEEGRVIKGHVGVDISVCKHAKGDWERVIASADGLVLTVTGGTTPHDDEYNGEIITVLHSTVRGSRIFLYAHLANVTVKVGDRVRRGQVIGDAWQSRSADWMPHVHLEWLDRTIPMPDRDPMLLVRECSSTAKGTDLVLPVEC